MAYIEPRSFRPDPLGPEERDLLRTAERQGRVSATLTEGGPGGGDGMARYAVLEALCAKGLLAYDGDDGLSDTLADDLELGFVLTEAGRTVVGEAEA